jgi:phosphoglycolate phosphatase-like HAD superfamily hydrolase
MSKGKRLSIYMSEKHIDPKHGIIVGDSIEEIEIGRAEGMVTVAITGGGAAEQRLRAEKPDYVIHSLHELKPILRERSFVA